MPGPRFTADGFVNNTDATGGAILAGAFFVYVDNSNGLVVSDELMRIQEAIGTVNDVVSPYGTTIYQVDTLDLANITLTIETTSILGGLADGVLGCTADGDRITLIHGWNWYSGRIADHRPGPVRLPNHGHSRNRPCLRIGPQR